MRSSHKRALAAAALALVLAPAASSQEDDEGGAPRSLLPAGRFGGAESGPVVEETAPVVADDAAAPALAGETPAEEAKPLPGTLPQAAVYADVRRAGYLARPLGLGDDLWRGVPASGARTLIELLPRTYSARQTHVLVRRALVSQALSPTGLVPADFSAARIKRLLVMGEVDAAKRLIGTIPLTNYSRDLYAWAAQAHLAAMDIGAVCPLVPGGETISADSLWTLTSAICRALQGDEQGAALELDKAREKRTIHPVDLQVTDRLIVGIGSNARGSTDSLRETDRLTTFRLAATMVAGTPPPQALLERQPVAIKAWLARTSLTPHRLNRSVVHAAAISGVLTGPQTRSALAAATAGLDPQAFGATPEGRVRTAALSRRTTDKAAALRQLWDAARTPDQMRLAGLAAARVAGQVPVAPAHAGDAGTLVRLMVLGGDVRSAARWWPVVRTAARDSDAAGDSLLRIWPLVMTLGKTGTVPRSADLAELWYRFHGDAESAIQDRRAALFGAVLDGIGAGFPRDQQDDLPRAMRSPGSVKETAARAALAQAAAAGRRGEAVLRAAALLGTSPATVDANDVRAALAALRRVGLSGEARLIGAELLILNGV